MDLNLLEKTTFWVDDVHLQGTDLGALAAVAAEVLALPRDEVMVVDVRAGLVAFDVLRPNVQAEAVAGKEQELLRRLGEVAGVSLGEGAAVHSEGVLGLIALDGGEGARVVEAASAMGREVSANVARRALVFASGSEVRDGTIRDTNTPFLAETLRAAGLRVELGGVLEDDLALVVRRLDDAVARGFGLVVTTGGVGAEDKDFNIEAVLQLDPQAHTPWVLRFTPDMRRHHKPGVRVAVGRVGPTRLVALPGPHDEVRAAAEVLVASLAGSGDGRADGELAEALAAVLRARWQDRMQHGRGAHA